MTTISILGIPDDAGILSYEAVCGDRSGSGKTPGEALDAVASQLCELKSNTLVVLQNNIPDTFFDEQQRNRLAELMDLWRHAKENDEELPKELLAELEGLAQAEVWAAGERAKSMADSLPK